MGEGKDVNEYAMSQMLMAEGEELYSLLQKFQPTVFVPEKSEDNAKFWSETVPTHMMKLDALMSKPSRRSSVLSFFACSSMKIGGASGSSFTSTGTSPGELVLFSYLYQMSLLNGNFMRNTPHLLAWFDFVRTLPATERVLSGQSAMGKLQPYFIKVGKTKAPLEPEVSVSTTAMSDAPADGEQKSER